MNLRFRVIWIEDSHTQHEEEVIADGIRQAGFEAEFFVDPTGERIDEFAEQQRLFNDFDFLLLDLKLAHGVRGDNLAPHIRERFRSTPILFYSSEPVERLREIMLEKNVEGVFCAHRENMPQRVGEMVSDLSVSLNRLAGMRGLAARVVAECDDEFRAIIREACIRPGEIDQNVLCQEFDEMVKQGAESSTTKYKLCTNLEERLASRSITSFHLWKAVLKITKGAKSRVEGMAENRDTLKQFNPKIITPRNSLSHVLETRGSLGWQLTGHGPGEDITLADFPKLRSDFIIHLENIKAIRRKLAGKKP